MTTSNTTQEALLGEAQRFAQLKAQFAKCGYEINHFNYYLADGYGKAHHLPTLADAEKLLKQIGGADHDV